ncbi:MAG: rRNA maturation RNase YbeY [Firmicutes bacterium]|nr:rRNA maturation RNase YbeY [Bacillota bacterium]
MELIFSEESLDRLNIDDLEGLMTRAATMAVEGEEIDPEPVVVSVTFVEPEEIRELNGQYRGKDAVTDVLSFPQFDDWDDLPEEGEIVLGDVVICMDQAARQAEEFGHSLEREVLYLFVHSIYHLLGYDHMEEDEKREMRQKEEDVMARLGLTRE